MKLKLGVAFILCIGLNVSFAQSGWTLQKCIDHALQNNLSIKQGELNLLNSHLNYNQSIEALAPSVSGFANNNYNFGRTINPVNNTYVQQKVQSASFGLNGQLVLFNGFANTNNIKLNRINEAVSKKDLEVISNNVALQVATQFLQILFNGESVKIGELAIASTEKQLKNAKVLFEAGNSNQSIVYELEAKLANDKLNLVTAQNNHKTSLVAMANLLQLPYDENFKIESPEIKIPNETISDGNGAIYESAKRVLPEIELAILRHKAALAQKNISKGAYYPTLSLVGGVNTLFSDNFKDYVNLHTITIPVGFVGSTNEIVYAERAAADGVVTRRFGAQTKDNIGKAIGFSLSIPIYSNARVRTSVKQADLAITQQALNMKRVENDLLTSVSTALANYSGALAKYEALVNAVTSQKKNFDFNTMRFEAGALSSNDLVISQTAYETSETNLLQGKYELIFRKVLLDFYRGKPIAFDK